MSQQVAIEIVESPAVSVEVVEVAGVEVIELIYPGPQGTPGPIGPSGSAGAVYIHNQLTPATTWTINHNLGFRPAVEILDSGSQEIDGAISHPTVNQTVITLSPATAGLARLL